MIIFTVGAPRTEQNIKKLTEFYNEYAKKDNYYFSTSCKEVIILEGLINKCDDIKGIYRQFDELFTDATHIVIQDEIGNYKRK